MSAATRVPAEVRVWRADVPAQPEAIEALAGALTDGERAWAARLRAGGARERFIVGRAALRRILAAQLGRAPGEVVLRTGEGGKPELAAGAGARPHFSVSHSGDAVLVATAPHPIGIDVERPRRIGEVVALAARIFSPSEAAWIERAPATERVRRFLEIWTAKEAVLKAAGDGLPGLAAVEISIAPGGATAATRAAGERWALRTFEPAPSFVAAVAAGTLPDRIEVLRAPE